MISTEQEFEKALMANANTRWFQSTVNGWWWYEISRQIGSETWGCKEALPRDKEPTIMNCLIVETSARRNFVTSMRRKALRGG